MYLPYVRGKQFELIGLRELAPMMLSQNRQKISPVIEPVRNSSTLRTTLKSLTEHNINFTVIINPQVGTFQKTQEILELIRDCVDENRNFQLGIIFHKKINHDQIIGLIKASKSFINSLTLIHNTDTDEIESQIQDYEKHFTIQFNIINLGSTSRRYHRRFDRETLVELDDYFIDQKKNADYLNVVESAFSEEHLYYKEEGYKGFSDYLSIGENYSESGFLPYAVAIHLSFSDAESKIIKIKHFVSDSNEDNKNVAGKFAEALDKLITWCDQTSYDSEAVQVFRELHKKGHFPGLGTIKKLSMMNHIELVLKLI